MAVPAHLSLVTLGVADVARSTSFYESLGWQRAAEGESTITFLRLGTPGGGWVVLGLFGASDLAEDAHRTPAADATAFRGVTLASNQPSRDDVDRVVAAFVTAGATLAKAPELVEWGGYSGYVADPDGHLWEIAHNPYSPEWAAPPV
ncbi:MAG: VOC family protein [Acidimicrobiales bacterium]|nr:VOC family protein [Acidimicrobiales bacterium]MCB9394586.1 VOC family protein [Acidimicrobiaceae bacterium]